MKKNLFAIMAMAAMVATVATSCDDSDDNKGPKESYELSGDLKEDLTISGSEWKLTGSLIVTDGVSLTMEAGTVLNAEAGFGKYILVDRGGKIFIKGTAAAPVTITCIDEDDTWGGLIINGKAPIAGKATSNNEGTTEVANAYAYGGTDAADNSGSIEYLKLLCTGARSSADIEHNGLTLNGVGSGTKIDNIYVNATHDDAVEFFGGSVNVTNFLAVNPDDDMFDFTQGFTGSLTNCYGIWDSSYKTTEGDPRGVEADGNLDGKTPTDNNQSNFKITNMTIVNNAPVYKAGTYETFMHDAIKLRRGANAIMKNVLIKGSGSLVDMVDVKDGSASTGDAKETAVIEYTSEYKVADLLTYETTNDDGSKKTVVGKELTSRDGSTYNGIKAVAGNTGCTADFSWTGYKF